MPDVWMSDFDPAGWPTRRRQRTDPFVVKGVLTIILFCLLCGMVGAMVVGNRMAFF